MGRLASERLGRSRLLVDLLADPATEATLRQLARAACPGTTHRASSRLASSSNAAALELTRDQRVWLLDK